MVSDFIPTGFFFQYVRLSTRSDLHVVASLLMKYWGLNKPRLVISITGEGSEILNDPMKTRFFTSAFENIVKEKGIIPSRALDNAKKHFIGCPKPIFRDKNESFQNH